MVRGPLGFPRPFTRISKWRKPTSEEREDIVRYISETSRFDMDQSRFIVENAVFNSNIIVKDKFVSDVPGGFVGRIVILIDPEEGPHGVTILKYENNELISI